MNLGVIQQEERHNPRCQRQLNALRFYLQQILWQSMDDWLHRASGGLTNYVELLDYIERWRHHEKISHPVSLVTFNYDLLLDEACKGELGCTLGNLDAYLKIDGYHLFKLHGSV